MKYFYDSEFLDDGRKIALISIGIVAEDGREFYAVNSNAPWSLIAEQRTDNTRWLTANVIPYLPVEIVGPTEFRVDYDHPAVMPYDHIGPEVLAFFMADGHGDDRAARELWAWYNAHDHIALTQLWGPMTNLPDGVPMFTRDLKGEHVRLGRPEITVPNGADHHALADARWNVKVHEFMTGIDAARGSLSADACAIVAGFLAGSDDKVNVDGIWAGDDVWDELHKAFPVSTFQAWAKAHPADAMDANDGIGYDPDSGL